MTNKNPLLAALLLVFLLYLPAFAPTGYKRLEEPDDLTETVNGLAI